MDLLPYQEEAAFPVRFLRNHTLSTLADVPADPRDTLGECISLGRCEGVIAYSISSMF